VRRRKPGRVAQSEDLTSSRAIDVPIAIDRLTVRSTTMLGRRFLPLARTCPHRTLSSLIQIHPEVQSALSSGVPIVALESTIITHGARFPSASTNSGMPFPQNLEMALSVESVIRRGGAIPATISCLNGTFRIGMSRSEIELLATARGANKISRRDLAVVSARGTTGGTTIAGTMILAHMAGIKIFATGVGTLKRGVKVGTWRRPSWWGE
jgi:pseudouridine-5'-phosphate glycosidase